MLISICPQEDDAEPPFELLWTIYLKSNQASLVETSGNLTQKNIFSSNMQMTYRAICRWWLCPHQRSPARELLSKSWEVATVYLVNGTNCLTTSSQLEQESEFIKIKPVPFSYLFLIVQFSRRSNVCWSQLWVHSVTTPPLYGELHLPSLLPL